MLLNEIMKTTPFKLKKLVQTPNPRAETIKHLWNTNNNQPRLQLFLSTLDVGRLL